MLQLEAPPGFWNTGLSLSQEKSRSGSLRIRISHAHDNVTMRPLARFAPTRPIGIAELTWDTGVDAVQISFNSQALR